MHKNLHISLYAKSSAYKLICKIPYMHLRIYVGFGGKTGDNKLLVFWRFLTHLNIFPSFKNKNLILIVLIIPFVQNFYFLTKIKKFLIGKKWPFFDTNY